MEDVPDLDILIKLSVAQAALRVTTEVEQHVSAVASDIKASKEQEALCLWLCCSRAMTRYPGPIEPIMRWCKYILKENVELSDTL